MYNSYRIIHIRSFGSVCFTRQPEWYIIFKIWIFLFSTLNNNYLMQIFSESNYYIDIYIFLAWRFTLSQELSQRNCNYSKILLRIWVIFSIALYPRVKLHCKDSSIKISFNTKALRCKKKKFFLTNFVYVKIKHVFLYQTICKSPYLDGNNFTFLVSYYKIHEFFKIFKLFLFINFFELTEFTLT